MTHCFRAHHSAVVLTQMNCGCRRGLRTTAPHLRLSPGQLRCAQHRRGSSGALLCNWGCICRDVVVWRSRRIISLFLLLLCLARGHSLRDALVCWSTATAATSVLWVIKEERAARPDESPQPCCLLDCQRQVHFASTLRRERTGEFATSQVRE